MLNRYTALFFAASLAAVPCFAQAPAPGTGRGISDSVSKEVKGLTSEDFPERQAALEHLQTLVAGQIAQRAQIQEILASLQADLAQQGRALAMVSNDEEAQAQIAGLLEMERGLSGWTIQTMSEPLERRTQLLTWGLTKEHAGVLARCYAQSKRARLEGIRQLAKLNDDGASWTLGRLINDPETAVRAAAMAAAWNRQPSEDVVAALWIRAITGPLALSDRGGRGMEGPPDSSMLKVDFPGGDPMEFGEDEDSGQFFDALLAGDVLVHLKSDLVAKRVKALVDSRAAAGKTLSLMEDPDWTLVTHRLVETYKVKEAIPLLASEALSTENNEMGGEMNGRPFMWTRRTAAIGTLAALIGKDASDFEMFRARDSGDSRGWMWAVDMNPNANGMNNDTDGAAVRAFFAFWKQHHAEYGVKEEPSGAGVPQPRPPRRGGRGQVEPAVPNPPVEDMTKPEFPSAQPYDLPAPEAPPNPQIQPRGAAR